MLNPRDKIGLELRKDILVKILPTLVRLIKRKVVGLYFPSLLVPSVG